VSAKQAAVFYPEILLILAMFLTNTSIKDYAGVGKVDYKKSGK
jgi:hypothetical protein